MHDVERELYFNVFGVFGIIASSMIAWQHAGKFLGHNFHHAINWDPVPI